MRLKILYIGDFTGKGDEGLTQISKKFYSHFKNIYEVKYFNAFEIKKFSSIKTILKFKPNIIHYLTGPTIRSFIISWILKRLLFGKTKTILSATRPFLNLIDRKLIRFFKPDFIFTQAFKWQILFLQYDIPLAFIPNPVNLNKFKELENSKTNLRKKYKLPLNRKLLLHVGHFRKNRKLDFFVKLQEKIQKKNYQIIIVGSSFYPENSKLISFLKNNNCIVIQEFIENIEEIYNACDYYIFPPLHLTQNYYPKTALEIGSIDMPISILESIVCKLPVISPHIDSLEILTRNINNPPILFANSNVESFISTLHYLEKHRSLNFSSIIEKIDSNVVFENVDKYYNILAKGK